MKRTMGGAALLAAVMALAPLQVDAQMGPRDQGGMMAGPRGAGVEMILRQKERLELTDDQVKQLDQIRRESVQRRTAHQAEMAELASKVRAGQMEASALREQMQARREGAADIREQQRELVEAVLNDAQKEKLQDWGGRALAFQMGRQSAMRGGQAFRGRAPQGGRRGGFAPRMRQRRGPGPMGRPGFPRGTGMGDGFQSPWDSIPGMTPPL
mgnify:CR=1 FL=1